MKLEWKERLFQKKEKQNMEKKNHHHIGFIVAAVCIVAIGITGAWLVNRANIATLLSISEPSTISVKGPNGEDMAQLDLSYTDADKDENGKVTIERVISVVSDKPEHKIEIAHTTNLKGLTFDVYKATDVKKDETTGAYTYNKISGKIIGDYLNLEKSTDGYQYADNTKHGLNYSDYQNVQSHAEPLYWLETDTTTVNNKNTDDLYLQNYVLVISWTESTKETDLFYVLAKNIEDTTTGN